MAEPARANDPIVLCAVGDIGADRADPNELFADIGSLLHDADVAFGQLELPITTRGTRLPQARHTVRSVPETAPALRGAGFDVLSFASNHVMDWGPDALFDTMDALTGQGIQVAGVGADIASAREPRIVDVDGTRIAFLAYCSILPQDYWATERRPGCTPMRAFTHYEQIEHDQPGTPARIRTFPHPDDLSALQDDIGRAREQADVVVMSIHWGIHFVPAVLAEYQSIVAHAAVDAGVDLVLGHHPHILKGVEVYRGVPIFYSLCNFAIDLPMTEEHAKSPSFKEIQKLNPDWEVDIGSMYNFPADSSKTVVARAEIAGGRIGRVSVLPVWIDRTAVPQVLEPTDDRFHEVVDYLREISAEVGFDTSFSVEGSQVTITGTG